MLPSSMLPTYSKQSATRTVNQILADVATQISSERVAVLLSQYHSKCHENERDMLWTDKYKPLRHQEVIGNEEQITMLSLWLSNWKQTASTDKKKVTDELDEFTTAVGSGPEGCGKTAAIYACAIEQGFNVIEINPSTKRSGARILELFGEATQSHHMEKWSTTPTTVEDVNTTTAQSDDSQDTLILFEEVDLLYEEDVGFFKAIRSLIHSTKRPIILTCNGMCIVDFFLDH